MKNISNYSRRIKIFLMLFFLYGGMLAIQSCMKDEPVQKSDPETSTTLYSGGHAAVYFDSAGTITSTLSSDRLMKQFNLRNVDSILYEKYYPEDDRDVYGVYCQKYTITHYSEDQVSVDIAFAKFTNGERNVTYLGQTEGFNGDLFYIVFNRMDQAMSYFDNQYRRQKQKYQHRVNIVGRDTSYMYTDYIPGNPAASNFVNLSRLFKRN